MNNHYFMRGVLGAGILLASMIGLTGCATSPTAMSSIEGGLKMAALSDMSPEVQAAPVSVQQAYRFAVANPETQKQIPCYCGCGGIGHTSNYDCYVDSQGTGTSLKLDMHALGCSLCVDITQDTMRLLKEGKSVREIRVYVDNTYAKYGTSNMPELGNS